MKRVLLILLVLLITDVPLFISNSEINCYARTIAAKKISGTKKSKQNKSTKITVPNNKEKQAIVRDTFDYHYHFFTGDTLIYTVMSSDSITINYGEPLLRIRIEKIMLTCDSISTDGDFHITQTLLEYKAKESFIDENNIERNYSPWVNVPIHLQVDSMGRRKKLETYSQQIGSALTPGGAFQPFILLPLDTIGSENSKYNGESWMFSRTDDIPENGMPIPLMRYTIYFRMIGFVDTLDLINDLKMTFAMTSQGTLVVRNTDLNVITTSVNNAGGEIFWDTTNWVPKFYTHTIEQKLTIYYPDEKRTDTGFHYIYSTFVLDKLIRKK